MVENTPLRNSSLPLNRRVIGAPRCAIITTYRAKPSGDATRGQTGGWVGAWPLPVFTPSLKPDEKTHFALSVTKFLSKHLFPAGSLS
jgi:hypothetical protein